MANIVVLVTDVIAPTTSTAPTVSHYLAGHLLIVPSRDTDATFTGVASDRENGALSARIVWMFHLDGQFGVGAIVTKGLSQGKHSITATVTDSAGLRDTANIVVIVTALVSPDSDRVFASTTGTLSALSATGIKLNGRQYVDFSWQGVTSTKVDIYRDGELILTTANDSAEIDDLGERGPGSYTYRVCAAGTTSTCSSFALVVF